MRIGFTRNPKKRKEEAVDIPNGEEIKNMVDNISESDIHKIIDKKLSIYETKPEPEPISVKEDVPLVKPVKDAATINYVEKVSGWNWNRALLYLTILGIMGIIFFSTYMKTSTAFLLLTWLFGSLCFLPLGLVFGWLFLNIDTRVLIMRRMRGKNYGLVNFIHRGGQKMVTRIKNFDDDVIIQDTKMWVLGNNGIYYMDRNRNLILHSKIESQHIKTMPSNIPTLYLDSDTMIPLTFHSVQSKSNPQQVGSTILGYIYNQLAKALFMKKGLQMFFLIVIIVTIITLVISLQNAMWLNEIHEELPKIENLMTKLGELINSYGVNGTSIDIGSLFPKPGGGT